MGDDPDLAADPSSPDVVNAKAYAKADDTSAGDLRTGAEVTSAIGGAASALTQISEGRTNREIAQANARYAMEQEAQDRQAGQFAAVRRGIVADAVMGRTRALQSGSGTVVGAGTNRLVTNDQKLSSAMDQYMLRLNAGRQARGAEVRATGDELRGDLAARAGQTGAITTALNTGSQEFLYSDPYYDPRYSRPIMS